MVIGLNSKTGTFLVLVLISGVNAKQRFDNSHLQAYEIVWPQPQAFKFKSALDGNVSNFWISKWNYEIIEPNTISRAGLAHMELSFSRYSAVHAYATECTRIQPCQIQNVQKSSPCW